MPGGICGVVDVTRAQVYRPKVGQRKLYSMKDKFHALKYELVVSLGPNQRIVWVNGPFPGSKADITCAREGLLNALGPGERLLGDKGYVGDARLLCPKKKPRNGELSQEEILFNSNHSKSRHHIERVNKRIKQFAVLSKTWRADHKQNRDCCEVVCKLTNIIFRKYPLSK